MKKTMKKIVALAASTLLFAGPVATPALAQTTVDEKVLTEITEANKHFESLKWDGLVKISAISEDQSADMGQFTFNGAFNGVPLQGSFQGTVSSLFLGGKPLDIQAFYQNKVAYVGTNGSTEEGATEGSMTWQAFDFATLEQEMIKNFQAAYSQQATVDPAKSAEFTNKYLNVTETETDYVYSLKQDINAEEMWADVDAIVDLEKLKENTIKNLEEQTGEKIDDAARAQIDKTYSSESLAKFLQMKPVIESSYNKETKQLSKVLMDLTVNMKDFMPEQEAASAEESGVPQTFLVHIELNFSDHNTPQEVVVPEEALSAEVQKPSSIDEAASELEELGEEVESAEETTTAAQ